MEDILLRFPQITKQIFSNLDTKSLVKSREVSTSWKHAIEDRKYFWVRMIKATACHKGAPLSKKLWGRSLENATTNSIRELANIYMRDELKIMKNQGITPLHFASLTKIIDVFQEFFGLANKKNLADNSGTTPLHFAAFVGNLQVCQLIINNVEDKNPKTSDGSTPLSIAAQNGHLEVCHFITSSMKKI